MGDVVPISRPAPACAGADPALFFPPNGMPEPYDRQVFRETAAKAVCARCPVRGDCLTGHMNERFGIWGGLTEDERRLARRREAGTGAA